MLIISSPIKRELGIYRNQRINDFQGNPHYGITLQVIRETTREEYLEYCKKLGALNPRPEPAFYYEILMD